MSANRILLQILAAKAGISVSFSNIDTFATDGKRVYVPLWAQGLPTDVSLGFFAHEAVGHIRMTDFETQSDIPLANSVLNLLEDIRIERMIPLIFPGARSLLAKTADYAATRFWMPPGEGGDADPLSQSFFWLARRLRGDILGQLGDGCSKLDLFRIEMTLSDKPGGWLDKCQQALAIACEALAKADKTADLLPASEAIARLFASSAPSHHGSQGDQGDRGNDGSHGNQGNGSSQGNQGDSAHANEGAKGPQKADNAQENGNQGPRGAPKGPESQGSNGAKERQSSGDPGAQGAAGDHGNQGDAGNEGSHGYQRDSTQGAKGGQGSHGDSGQGTKGTQVPQVGQSLQESLLQRRVNMDLGCLLLSVQGRANASWGVSRLKPEEKTQHDLLDRTSPDEREAAMRIAAKMRGGLQDALRRVLEDEDDRHTTAGRFDPRMAASAYKGFARDVFVEEGEQAPGLDARILLLIDASGSMSKLESGVRGMLCGIVEALGVIPEVDLGIAFYDSGITYITSPGATSRALIRAAKSYMACGSTDWHEAACEALPWFFGSKRARQKNILFTLTDGDVNMNSGSKVLLRKADVECRFLIIGDGRYPDRVAGAYPVARLAQGADATQVARGCLDLLKDGILAARLKA
jgi:hypothetical protein